MTIADWKKYIENDWNNIQYIEKPDIKYVSYNNSNKWEDVNASWIKVDPFSNTSNNWVYADIKNNDLQVDECKYDVTCENAIILYTCPVCGGTSLRYYQECPHCGSYLGKNIEID